MRRFSSVFKKKDDSKVKENGQTSEKVNGKRQSKAVSSSAPPAEPEDHSKARNEVSAIFERYAQVIHASREPLPTQSGDGTYLEHGHDHSTSLFSDLRSLGFKDYGTLVEVMKNKASGGYVDDKTMLMERIIQLVSGLPSNSERRTELTNAFLDELWDSLPHPPLSFVGPKFEYRSADGSWNNPTIPWLGAANTEYSRSIAPLTIQPSGLPDAGLIFDSIMAREKFTPHPNKVSNIFQTDYRNPHISQTSAYLDLSILYGDNQDDQNQMRTFKDGKIKPDSFSEPRLQAFPAMCNVLMVMLNRFHNNVVEQIAQINENGRFNKPRPGLSPEQTEAAWKKYDEDLFQTGRLITCGLYINITLYDYLRTIVNLNRTNSTWCLDPRARMQGTHTTPSGLGNQCSVEFNLAYRWHSATSYNDEKWTEEVYRDLFGKPAEEVSMVELLMGLNKYEQSIDKDPSKRTFANLQRQADGTFKDDDLVKIMASAVEDVAGSFGARNVPKVMRSIEILGIEQARKWNVGSLNEFRKFFNLKPYETFEEINSDPYVADQLRHLYEHPDYVELYPGIVAEEAKEPMAPGVGITPTYTISRAVLSDAVALVRGDRFYTTDQTPRNLTNWGWQESGHDLNINQGCVFYKLAFRAFPNHFKSDSIYAHYPMTIPEENKVIMKNLGREADYSWDPPTFNAPRVELKTYQAAETVLKDTRNFRVTWGDASAWVFGEKTGFDYMLSGDTPFHTKQRELLERSLYQEGWDSRLKEFYEQITLQLLHDKSYTLAGTKQVDLTRDVGNLATVHFAAHLFGLPLKTKGNPRGIFTEHELYMANAVIFQAVFFDYDLMRSYPLRQAARAVAKKIGEMVELNVKSIGSNGILSHFIDGLRKQDNPLSDYGVNVVKNLLDSGLNAHEVTWTQILPAVVSMVPKLGQVFTQIIDFYLSDAGKAYLPEINRLAKLNTPESDKALTHYVLEAIRLNGTYGAYREAQRDVTVNDGGNEIQINKGAKVFVSFISASRDPVVFPEPEKVLLDRPVDSYVHYGIGAHSCLGQDASLIALTSMLRVVGRLDNLRRARGTQGLLKKIPREGGSYHYLREDGGSFTPFPATFKVEWDSELPALKNRGTW
ncbi:uncharacterized protein BHQ10_003654 [Talaromyces amestolkiae]|uniref:Linoleate 8R-lipoxygenase n=1 Tax=Talaromyces amestolkiae TaxID=1196081 RepID=A0A364KVQ9_TALAM|nr:uncharacterized protein BHQ10_003654 [Talaromyces amestolkiae]RAO67642.1 hypothetical protein BHQ10_003654 [Talaromyces amestolkiae]